MKIRTLSRALPMLGAFLLSLSPSAPAGAQEARESDPVSALSAILVAACRANEAQFANYLTGENKAAYLALPQDQRTAVLKRISLNDDAGKPLISSDDKNRPVLHCQAGTGTTEFHFGDPRVHENLAFIPVSVVSVRETQFGLVRENGGWRLLSVGLVLFDIPQLSKEWIEQDLAAREDAVVSTLRALREAIESYRRAFGKLPESLEQLGPAPENQISPEQGNFINEDLAAGSQSGYQYRYRIVPAENGDDSAFELAASPQDYGKAGRRSFFLDSGGKVHGADKHGSVATIADPLIQGEKAP